jgi:hypothetical protein
VILKNLCGDSLMSEQLSLPIENAGANPSSPLDFAIITIDVHTACAFNKTWHSRLPDIHWSNVVRNKHYVCFGAQFQGNLHAVAIWSTPVAANRLTNGQNCLELRRFAIANTSPKNTATRMLSIMTKTIRKNLPNIVKLVSYQDMEAHHGTIYKAANWRVGHVSEGLSWTTSKRKRNKEQSTAAKTRWELTIAS